MKTFTSLTGTASNSSAVSYPDSFATRSNNFSAANVALGGVLINNYHRYLLQKYFDNERTYQTVTIGASTTTLTGSVAVSATTGTLSSVWTPNSSQQLVVFSSGEQRTINLTQNTTKVSWTPALTETATSALSFIGVQAYPIPATVSKIKNNTISVGQLVYTPAPVQSIQEWTRLNALPYTSDIPNYFYIYNNQVNFWPIPSTSGNVIAFNYKARVPDLSFADYSTGTLTGLTAGSNQITGSSTSWGITGTYPLGVDVSFFNLFLKISPPSGDGLWYQIKMFNSDTSLLLATPLQTVYSPTASTYTIGQLPLLQEDFQDMLTLGPLMEYYSTIVQDTARYQQFKDLYNQRLELMKSYLSDKSVNVDLGQQPVMNNPNLFIFAPPQ